MICRTEEEAWNAEEALAKVCQIQKDPEDFTNGVMVLPIHKTKGLEFDAAILWNPNEQAYPLEDAAARLLYVAITRALHELHIFYIGKLSKLLE